MKNLFIFKILAWIIFSSCCNNASHSPEIKMESIIDLGRIELGDSIERHVSLVNLERKEVDINYVKTPCGCLVAYSIKQMVEPNDSTMIVIVYKPMEIGYTEQNLFIYFAGYETPLHLLVKSRVYN